MYKCDDNGDCKTCSSNYELNTSKQCKLKKGKACTNSNQCSSNNCKTNCCESSIYVIIHVMLMENVQLLMNLMLVKKDQIN